MNIEVDQERVRRFVGRLCGKNLRDPRVQCCAACPWENAIVTLYPDLGPKFEEKRDLVREKGPTSKWFDCLEN